MSKLTVLKHKTLCWHNWSYCLQARHNDLLASSFQTRQHHSIMLKFSLDLKLREIASSACLTLPCSTSCALPNSCSVLATEMASALCLYAPLVEHIRMIWDEGYGVKHYVVSVGELWTLKHHHVHWSKQENVFNLKRDEVIIIRKCRIWQGTGHLGKEADTSLFGKNCVVTK